MDKAIIASVAALVLSNFLVNLQHTFSANSLAD